MNVNANKAGTKSIFSLRGLSQTLERNSLDNFESLEFEITRDFFGEDIIFIPSHKYNTGVVSGTLMQCEIAPCASSINAKQKRERCYCRVGERRRLKKYLCASSKNRPSRRLVAFLVQRIPSVISCKLLKFSNGRRRETNVICLGAFDDG